MNAVVKCECEVVAAAGVEGATLGVRNVGPSLNLCGALFVDKAESCEIGD